MLLLAEGRGTGEEDAGRQLEMDDESSRFPPINSTTSSQEG